MGWQLRTTVLFYINYVSLTHPSLCRQLQSILRFSRSNWRRTEVSRISMHYGMQKRDTAACKRERNKELEGMNVTTCSLTMLLLVRHGRAQGSMQL